MLYLGNEIRFKKSEISEQPSVMNVTQLLLCKDWGDG